MKMGRMSLLVVALALLVVPAYAATITVSTLPTSSPGDLQWYQFNVASGAASIVPNAPAGDILGPGAAYLTTTSNQPDKAQFGMSLGTSSILLSDLVAGNSTFSYSFLKQTHNVPNWNSAAAPSLKMRVYDAAYTTSGSGYDGYCEIIFEPCNNGNSYGTGLDQWINVSLNATSGYWWHTGIYQNTGGEGSQGGGPTWRTLSQLLTYWQSVGAQSPAIIFMYLGVGSDNKEHQGYIDAFSAGFLGNTYDFEPASNLPEPATVALMGLGLAGLLIRRR